MNARPRLSSLICFVAVVGACSSSDTILALTVTSGADVTSVQSLLVAVTPDSGTAFTTTFAPPLVDGSIKSSFFERIKLPSGLEGPATITVQAQNAGQTVASGQTRSTIVKDGTIAASIMLMPGGLPPPGDGGADAGDAGDAGAGGDAPASDGPATDGAAGDGDGG
jgi:hypothetical protein